MAGNGVKVGNAYVDTEIKADPKSVRTTGKQIQAQLSKLGNSLAAVGDRNREVYRSIGQNSVTAWRSLLGAIVSGAPLMGSAMSGVSGAATMLAGSLRESVIAAGALIPVATSLGLAGLTASIGMGDFGAALSEVDPKRLQLLLKDMPKSMQAAVMSTRAMSNEMRAVVWKEMYVGIGPLMERLRETGVIQRGLAKMAQSINYMARSVLRYTSSAQGVSVMNKFFGNNAKIFKALSKAVVPFLDGFLRLVNALTPAALRLSGRITDVGKRFQDWTKAPGFAKDIDDRMKGAEKTAGLLFRTLGNLWAALSNVFNAANPATNMFLGMLEKVTQRFQDWTESVGGQNSIATWAEQSVDVMRQFGSTISAVFDVIQRLADPRVIISFLKTVETAFEYLAKLPLEGIVDGFVRMAEMLQPISGLFLAVIISSAALNILLGSLIGQVGGVASVLSKLLKFKILTNILKGTSSGAKGAGTAASTAAKKTGLLSRAWNVLVNIVNKVKAAFAKVINFFRGTGGAVDDVASKAGRFSGAFKPVMSVLSKIAKFAGPVGLAVWIGSLIGGSDKLQSKFGELWGAMKKVGSSIGGAFAEIGEALKPLAPAAKGAGSALGFIFGIIDKIATLAIGVVLDTIIYGFESLANVIKGAGSIIAGVINTLTSLFTGDWSGVMDGLKQIASGIIPLMKGIFGIFISFFAPARLLKIGTKAMKGLGGGIKSATPGILSTVGSFLANMLKFFATLPMRLLSLGGRAITALAGAIVRATPKVLSFVGSLVAKIIVWIAKLPGRLMSLGWSAIKGLGSAIAKGHAKVMSIVLKVFKGIINHLKKLPGRLLAFGKQAITFLGNAFRAGISKLRGFAGKIVSGIIGFIRQLPGKLKSFGTTAISRLGSAFRTGVSKLRGIAGDIMSAVVNTLKDLPGKMLTAGKNAIAKVAEGILGGLGKIKDAMGKVGGAIKKFLPGSPIEEGPLKSWNNGGAGKRLVQMLAGGIGDNTDIARREAEKLAEAISFSSSPKMTRPTSPGRGYSGSGPVESFGASDVSMAHAGGDPSGPNIVINQNEYGPRTSGDKNKDLEWNLKWAVGAGLKAGG